jgi:hypothetical protein
MPSNGIKLDLKILKEIEKELNTNEYVKIGILGSKNSRNDANTNAGIGIVHEFGSASKNIPERSFLRMPLKEKLPNMLSDIGKSVILGIVRKNANLFLKKMGVLGEQIIQEAFDTGGFGKWQKLDDKTIKRKGFDKTLIDTTQLRKSVTSEVKK